MNSKLIKVGQILWLRVRYQIDKVSDVKHPMLIAKICDDYIEVIALDKTFGKLHQLYRPYNYYIDSENPKETVLYEDSYAQLNTKITLEWNECLLNSRKSDGCLSKEKLKNVLLAYKEYQTKNTLLEERIVHMQINEIIMLNPELKEFKTK